MFETANTPVRPPLRPPAQSPPRLPKPTNASSPHRYARRANPAKGARSKNNVSKTFIAAKEMTMRAAHDISRQYGEGLTREECVRLVSVFRAGSVPRRKAGRRPKPQVTAAYLDWKAGMRGVTLFRKHIPGWDGHHRYHKNGESKELMDAIRSRFRRERRAA